jgi:hypothetical protein
MLREGQRVRISLRKNSKAGIVTKYPCWYIIEGIVIDLSHK